MFVQTEITPNPNSLKFIPGKVVSKAGSFEINQKDQTESRLVKDLLSINGIKGIFLSQDFLSVIKEENADWEDLKHIVISFINEFYSEGNEFVIDSKVNNENSKDLIDIEKKNYKDTRSKN